MTSRSIQALREELLSGIGVFTPKMTQSSLSRDYELEETWRCYRIAPGGEVSFCDDLLSLDRVGVEDLLSQMREIVVSNRKKA